MRITTEFRAAVLADHKLSVRTAAKKHGCAPSTIGKIRKTWAALNEGNVQPVTAADVQKQQLDWLETARGVLVHCAEFLDRAAKVDGAERDPKMIHAVMGGTKILVDAVAQWRMSDPNAGRNTTGNADGQDVPVGAEIPQGSNVIPIRAEG